MAAQKAKAKLLPSLLPSAPAGTGPEFMVRITTTDARDNEAHGYLQVELGPDGRIVDMYDHGLALSASGQLAFSAAGMLTSGEVARVLLGISGDAVEVAVLMQRLTAAVSVGDTRRAHGVLLEMPESIRARREFATLRVAMSRSVGIEAYREALAELARRHGEVDDLQFILIDHYLLSGQHELALRAVDRAARIIGDDEVMDLNRCTALLALGRKADALAACDRAIARDPAWESPRWTRVRIGLETQDAQLAIESLTGIEQTRGGKRFDVARLAANKTYAWLITQPEFTTWAAERGGPAQH
jgi:tetratricopeptide (TPR) repeat protein